ncbi:unnamed protein product [Dicrocoelium dendriticum]|nr:unnamed protein product [Dicrocoelium dendriticum]
MLHGFFAFYLQYLFRLSPSFVLSHNELFSARLQLTCMASDDHFSPPVSPNLNEHKSTTSHESPARQSPKLSSISVPEATDGKPSTSTSLCGPNDNNHTRKILPRVLSPSLNAVSSIRANSMAAMRPSLHPTSGLRIMRPAFQSHADFAFDFDADGILRNLHTGEPLSTKINFTGASLRRQEFIRAYGNENVMESTTVVDDSAAPQGE